MVKDARSAKLGSFEHGTFKGGYTDDSHPAEFRDGHAQETQSKDVGNTRRKIYADYVAKCMKWAAAASAKVDGSPTSLQAFTVFVERQEREVAVFLRGPGPTDRLVGMGNPPMMLPEGRKEPRHRDTHGKYGSRSKKAKSEELARATPT